MPKKKKFVLVIDDSHILHRLIGTQLISEGYDEISLDSAEEALSYFEKNQTRVDALIVDLTLPEMSGIELAKKMLEIKPNLPVILVTGVSTEVVEAGKKRMFHRIIHKPFSKADILEAIESAFRKPGGVKKAGDKHLVLIIDDEEAIEKAVEDTLHARGLRTASYTDVDMAFEFFKKNHDKIDLIIADLTIPSRSGLDIRMECRVIEPNLPMILMTSEQTYTDHPIAASEHFPTLLRKPIDSGELAQAVRAVLGREG